MGEGRGEGETDAAARLLGADEAARLEAARAEAEELDRVQVPAARARAEHRVHLR